MRAYLKNTDDTLRRATGWGVDVDRHNLQRMSPHCEVPVHDVTG